MRNPNMQSQAKERNANDKQAKHHEDVFSHMVTSK